MTKWERIREEIYLWKIYIYLEVLLFLKKFKEKINDNLVPKKTRGLDCV